MSLVGIANALDEHGSGSAQAAMKSPACRQLEAHSGDGCGVLRLAGRSVATPFTGAVAGAMAIGELLRLCHGGARVEFTSLHLAHPDRATVIAGEPWAPFNPGLVLPTTMAID